MIKKLLAAAVSLILCFSYAGSFCADEAFYSDEVEATCEETETMYDDSTTNESYPEEKAEEALMEETGTEPESEKKFSGRNSDGRDGNGAGIGIRFSRNPDGRDGNGAGIRKEFSRRT